MASRNELRRGGTGQNTGELETRGSTSRSVQCCASQPGHLVYSFSSTYSTGLVLSVGSSERMVVVVW